MIVIAYGETFAMSLGISGTPTFAIGERVLVGEPSIEALEAFVDRAS